MNELAAAISAQVPAAGKGGQAAAVVKPLASKAERETTEATDAPAARAASDATDPTSQQLQNLTQGLQFVSESEAPLEVVSYEAPGGALTEAALLKITGQPASASVETVDLMHFLRNHTADDGVLGDPELANRYKALQMFLKQELEETKVYRVGTGPQVQAYALGRTTDGKLAGFKTVLTET
ncbi:nuclease A inhibitor family protein [Hymenobacter cellulosilyticus]|uniref:Nuclease A inhibitor family protein n=2 Tax=Hymenobacter cellulosilyticus TaxID=2932248 RepID=A0A8T9QBY3_9BACT|nr:nuclease A inhibitor family protein [Hymenobacter cellulosilyticus]UOQ75017.1 nuclease A inhibitor family protein [Hymenobacter cellulosilyticus]